MGGQILTSLISFEQNKLDPCAFTSTSPDFPTGSPVLFTVRMSEQPSSLVFLQTFVGILRANWRSQDQPLVSYRPDETASSAPYTLPYRSVEHCTRFSSFVKQEIGETSNVNAAQLTHRLLSAISNTLIDSTSGIPTSAGMQFWAQFASSNPNDKLNLVIADISIGSNVAMIPKCSADMEPGPGKDDRFTGCFGIEVLHI